MLLAPASSKKLVWCSQAGFWGISRSDIGRVVALGIVLAID
jgi:hypothetical protein